MATNLTCPTCHYEFVPKVSRREKSVRCPMCGEVHPDSSIEELEAASKPTTDVRGIKCPGCKRVLACGVRYCVACNISLFNPWGEIEENAPKVGRQEEIKGYVSLATKTVRIFIYFVTLRWGRLLEELL